MKIKRSKFKHRMVPFIIFTCLLVLTSAKTDATDYIAYKTATAPTIDGVGIESCWSNAQWAYINQPIDNQSLPDSTDFYGRYKIVWTSSRLYILMEITDEKLVDNRINPREFYWEDDCTEFFIDEDHIPEEHECNADAFNAFAYHIAAVPRDKNNYENGSIVSFDSSDAVHHVIDLGNDCNTGNALNLDDHVITKISKNANTYTWELEFKIFSKNYVQNSNSNVPVTLTANKTMGFAIAYCDDDNGRRENMIGTVANHNDYSGKYPFYRFTNEYETLTLKDSVLTSSSMIDMNIKLPVIISTNPSKDNLNIEITNKSSQLVQINVIDLLGHTMISRKVEEHSSNINISNLKPGLYIVNVYDSGIKYQQKFIKR